MFGPEQFADFFLHRAGGV